MRKLVLASLLLIGVSSGAQAAPLFYSGDGSDVLVSSVAPGAVTTVTKHGVWGDVSTSLGEAADTAKWISYGNTGLGGFVAPNITDIGAPGPTGDRIITNSTAHFRRNFSLAGASTFSFSILADDTATVLLDGVQIFGAYQGQIDPCAPGGSGVPIGCVNADMGKYVALLAAGAHVLDVYVYQTNHDVFGTQYIATAVEPRLQDVPEPTALILLGLSLVGLARRIR